MDTPVTIVILAAGLGTRMKSRQAKVLHRAGGLALIEHVVDTALKLARPEQVFVVVGHEAGKVRAAVENRRVRFVMQTDQKGTGHAVMACRDTAEASQGQLLVLYGDVPLLSSETLQRLIDRHRQTGAAAVAITTHLEDPTGYGRVIRDKAGHIQAIVEQKAATPEQLGVREINAGIYCFDAGLLWKHIDGIQPHNLAREYYLTDIVEIFHRSGHTVVPFLLENAEELLGINTRLELAAVDKILRERAVRRVMLDGVTIQKPETVTVDASVSIGIDTVIEPFAQVLGNTVIGEACHIGACSIIRDSTLSDRVVVKPFTSIDRAQIDAEAEIGPFSRLRPETHVEKGASVGNFVEVKKTRIGPGSKSMHLAYLGDAVIGADVNIGAGTITCNYDGQAKHRTTIGNRSFIGSNATLVAPVEIGDEAYVAAGSVVTESVPNGALALGRARQVNKLDWVKKR